MKTDGYPAFKDAEWFMKVVESLVSNPTAANIARVKGGNDLEIRIYTAEEDRHVFTENVCLDLETLVSKKTGIFSPVIYLWDNPHERARRAIETAGQW